MSTVTEQTGEVAALRAQLVAATAALKEARRASEDFAVSGQKNADEQKRLRASVVESTRAVEAAKAEYVNAAQQQEAAAKRAEDAAKRAASALADSEKKHEKARELLAKGASDELPEKIKNVIEGVSLAKDGSLDFGTRFTAAFGAAGIAAGLLTRFVGETGRAIMEAEVQTEALQRRSQELAGTMEQVRAATGGAGTAADAAAARYALLDAGLAATATNTASVLEYARAHRRANEETTATVGRVVAAMQGNAAAADELGVRLRTGATAAEQAAGVLDQLAAANQRSGAAAETAAERQARQAENVESARRAGLALVDAYFGVSDLYRAAGAAGAAYADVQAWVASQTAAGREEQDRAAASIARRADAEKSAGQVQQARARAEAAARDEATAAAQRELGVQAALLAAQGEAVDASVRQVSAREAYADVVTRSLVLIQREGETDEQFAQRRLAGMNAIQQARQRALDVERQAANQARSRDELGVLAASLRSHGIMVSSQVRSVSVQQQYNNLLREARDLRRSELETQQEFEQRESETLQRVAAARQAAVQRAAQATQTMLAAESLGILQEQTQADASLRRGFSSDTLLRVDPRQLRQISRLVRDAQDARARGGEDTSLAVLQRRVQAQQQLNQLLTQYRDLNAQIASADARLAQHRVDPLTAATDAARDAEVAARTQALGQNTDQFAQLRAGIGRQTMIAQLSRESARGLQRGTVSEADLRAEIDDLETRAADALSQGTQQSAQRAAAFMQEAQALAGVIDGQRQLADAMRESNNAGVQFAAAFAGSEEAARRTAFTAQDAAKYTKGAFDVITSAGSDAFGALIEGSASAEEAFAQFGRNALKGLAQYFFTQAIAEGAAAIGSAAVLNFPGAALHAAAAAGWGTAAALAGGIYVATAPAKPAETSSAAGTGSQARGSDASSRGGEGGTTVIQYNFNGLVTETQAAHSIKRILDRGNRAGIRPNADGG